MKKNGFSLIELILVIGIMSILGSALILSTAGIGEKNALRECETRMPIFFRNYIDRSFDNGERYRLEMDLGRKRITVYSTVGNYKIDELKLNNSLGYYKKDDEERVITREVTERGNFSKGFSIVIGDKKREKMYRKITGDNTLVVRYGIIRMYFPKNGDYIIYGSRGNDMLWEFQRGK